LLQIPEEPKLMLINKEEGSTFATCSSSCTPNSMDVIFWIIWWIELYDPINVREVKTSLSDISAQKNAGFSLSILEIG
jgi:hypothetical protein